ncbi:MAG: ferredoxin [Albidovulum sp.]
MDLAPLATHAAGENLAVFGAFHPSPADGLPEDIRTLVLLGPAEPGFWPHLNASPEMQDGLPDPIDRWSSRVISKLADALGGKAYYPFGGPPYHPFYSWALRSGRAWAAPVRFLVHDTAGLFVSYRGAIGLPDALDLPAPPAKSPCDACTDKPCLAACPPGALGADGYNLPACHQFLDKSAGKDCLSFGCAVRRACPLSQAYGRLPEQSAYHMGLFHK